MIEKDYELFVSKCKELNEIIKVLDINFISTTRCIKLNCNFKELNSKLNISFNKNGNISLFSYKGKNFVLYSYEELSFLYNLTDDEPLNEEDTDFVLMSKFA